MVFERAATTAGARKFERCAVLFVCWGGAEFWRPQGGKIKRLKGREKINFSLPFSRSGPAGRPVPAPPYLSGFIFYALIFIARAVISSRAVPEYASNALESNPLASSSAPNWPLFSK